MKRPLIAAAVVLLVMPCAAGASSPHVAGKAPEVHRFALHASAVHVLGPHHSVGTDVARSGGKVVGYDSFSEFSNPRTRTVDQFGLALKGGVITGRVVQRRASPDTIKGPILAGSGIFAGIQGTAVLKLAGSRQILILRYRL